MAKKNPSVLWTVEQSLAKAEKKTARANIGVDSLPTQSHDNQSTLTFVSDIVEDATTGNLSCKTKKVKVSNTYDAQSSDPASGTAIAAAINKLNLNNTLELGKYYSGISVANGVAVFSQSAMDTVPTLNSQGLHDHEISVTSDGVARALNAKVINNASLKIQKNGVDVATFTANSATNVTANISVPTKTSDLSNDSGFITSSSIGNGTISIYQNNTLANSFTTNRSTNLRIDLDDTKNTVGTGAYTGTSGDAETAYIPFTTSNAASSQQSYVQYQLGSQAAADLFKLSKDTNDYWSAKLDGTTLAKFIEPSSGQTADQLMVTRYDDKEEIVPLRSTIGNTTEPNVSPMEIYQPVYVKDGVITELPRLDVDVDDPNPANSYDSMRGGITLRYDASSGNKKYHIGSLGLVSYYPYVAATTGASAVDEHFGYKKTGGFVFGDGLGIGTSNGYWGLNVPNHGGAGHLIVEAPSITYALTTWTYGGSESATTPYEIWNPHRWGDYTEVFHCRNAEEKRAGSLSEYITTTTFKGNDGDICVIPPHHWGLIYATITAELDSNIEPEGIHETLTISIQDAANTSFTGDYIGEHSFRTLYFEPYIQWGRPEGHPESTYTRLLATRHIPFMCYNPSNAEKYIHLQLNGNTNKTVHVYKQMIIFKTPEYDGFNLPYVAPPSSVLNASPSE